MCVYNDVYNKTFPINHLYNILPITILLAILRCISSKNINNIHKQISLKY